MTFTIKSMVRGLSAAAGCVVLVASVDAACNCRGNVAIPVAQHGGLPPAPRPAPPLPAGSPVPLVPIPDSPPVPITPSPANSPTLSSPANGGSTLPSAPMASTIDPLSTAGGVNRFGVTPPPGTLGRTYQRRSTLAPDDKHPRYGAVNVHLPEDVDVTARGLKSTWTGEVWLLEAETPLLPGVPHIYAIKAERNTGQGDKSTDVRWVRLIMGRVVELDF